MMMIMTMMTMMMMTTMMDVTDKTYSRKKINNGNKDHRNNKIEYISNAIIL